MASTYVIRYVSPKMIVCIHGCCTVGHNQELEQMVVWRKLFHDIAGPLISKRIMGNMADPQAAVHDVPRARTRE